MGKITGFLEHQRETPARRNPAERIKDWFEIYQPFPEESSKAQGARCMDCGVPFCHTGCPLNNLIPDWNDLVYRGRWREAIRVLHATNNFPEFTGRICPAPCEAACVLGIHEPPVTIKSIEQSIVERCLRRRLDPSRARAVPFGKVRGNRRFRPPPAPGGTRSNSRRLGHSVTVFEKADRIGGLLRYGIPNFKMEKRFIDRRLEQMSAEGVEFVTNAHVGENVKLADLQRDHDAILLAGGAEKPRDLGIPGRELSGIHYAMEFLTQQNRRNQGDDVPSDGAILATGRNVVIIGGGDTGADCLGTSHRQGARSVTQLELLPKPPDQRADSTPWPLWPMQLRVESSHEEGGLRDWAVSTAKFSGDANGRVARLHAMRVGAPPAFQPIPGSEFTIEADLVLLAMGFTGPVQSGLLESLGVAYDKRGNVSTGDGYMSSVPGVFAAGDARRGQSLIVWAIAEGRKAAADIHRWLSR